jgi:PhoPQ-activated pathogenicity-related protein
MNDHFSKVPGSRSRAALFSVMFVLVFAFVATAQETALDRYIAKPDPAYSWKLVNTVQGAGYKAFVLELTSQTWRSAAEVDRPVWKHWLTIVRPETVTTSKALLFIGGGNNTDAQPKGPSERLVTFATETGSVVAELGMVPNQPLFFADSKDKGRVEDDLIAYSRVKQIQTGDDYWLVRLAMVKSGVRALDAIQEFIASDAGGRVKADQFVVSGGSKRGWTSWLVGAVDKRVIAIMPVVIDALNSEAITRHHYEAYGFFSPALQDYVNHHLFPDKIGTSEYQHILAIEDPYNYLNRERLKIPKYLVNASGDQFFLPDNSQFYFGRVQGEKYLRYVPNAKHNLAGSDASQSLLAFYQAILTGHPRPQFSWTKEKDGSLVVTLAAPTTRQGAGFRSPAPTNTRGAETGAATEGRPSRSESLLVKPGSTTVPLTARPREVNLWQATNPKARDFRLDTIGSAYKSTPLKEERPGVYVGRVEKPPQGFTAFFVELVYDSGGKYPFKFTTEVSVVPDVLPFRFANAAKQAAR